MSIVLYDIQELRLVNHSTQSIMSTENAKKYLDDHSEKDITELMVEHGKAMGHEFSEKDLLEASGGGSISWKKSGVKWKL